MIDYTNTVGLVFEGSYTMCNHIPVKAILYEGRFLLFATIGLDKCGNEHILQPLEVER
jgi:hypothetical protein